MKTTEMPKSRVYQLDEYESGSDIDNTETLLSKHFSQQSTKKKKGSNKKSGKQKETPRKRAQSAPPAKVGRDLWMNAVKKRQTQNLTRSRPESPRHKTSTEYWVDTLRKTGIGRSTESTGMNTFSGKRPRDQDMAYLSTSAYMRQMMGAEKPQKYGDPTTKPPTGAPAYKTPEEYYDQVLELKKIIQGLNQEKNELKSKVRRTEEDNIKKEKEISGLLDPKKSDDVRRTLGTKQQDSASVIHSLKQKILKLEVQNRDRESAYVKLQTDLKTTKIDELKQQLEVCFQEIVRLQNSKGTGAHGSGPAKPGTDKRIKALNEAILRLNKENEQLKSESHGLKEDLNRQIDDKDITGEYEDMNRKQLIAAIKKIEKQKSKTEKTYKADKQGKIALEGSMEERLDQLDKRETELMDKVETQGRQITKLQNEKELLYRKLDDKEKIIVELEEQTGQRTTRSPSTIIGLRTPNQRIIGLRTPNQRIIGLRTPNQRIIGLRTPNQRTVGLRTPNQRIIGLRTPNQRIIGLRTPNQRTVGLRTPNQRIIGLRTPNQRIIGLRTPNQRIIGLRTPNQRIIGLRTPNQRTVGLRTPNQRTVGLRTPNQRTVGLRTPNQRIIGLRTPNQRIIGLRTPNQRIIGLRTPNQRIIGLRTPNQRIIGLRTPNQRTVGLRTPNQRTVGLRTPNQRIVGLRTPNQRTVGLRTPNQRTIGLRTPNQRTIGLRTPNQRIIGLRTPNQRIIGLRTPNQRTVGLRTPNQRIIGLRTPNQRTVGLRTPNQRIIGLRTPNQRTVGLRTPNQRIIGLRTPNQRIIGLRTPNQRTVGLRQH
ncbi:unnamed protein product [Mytilus coruscus]|uniref:Uncharacterized protein n=1 Tax=Mytilus coruscus TaxID=42192 RepID=A0A6J7ZXN8_MYTCO|nr:unnamed protein product [Mytilus coruscus]